MIDTEVTEQSAQPTTEPSGFSDNLDEFERQFYHVTNPDKSPKTVNTPAVEEAAVEEDNPLATEDSSSEEKEEETPPPQQKKKGFQERINELTAKAREAERREKAKEQELVRLQARLAELERSASRQPDPQPTASSNIPVVVEQAQPADNFPKPSDLNPDGTEKYPLGEFDPAYVADLARATIRKEIEEQRRLEEQRAKEQAERQAQETLQTEWQARVQEAVTELPDFVDKVVSLESTFSSLDQEYSSYLANLIKSMDNGPEVLYYLANNVQEAQSIVAKGPVQATLYLGQLQAAFKNNNDKTGTVVSSASPKPVVRPTNAPEPPRQLAKGASAAKPLDDDDLDAFEKRYYDMFRR